MISSDYSLLIAISEKDKKAFRLFYDRYIRLIYKFVFRELSDQQQTDDLIQEFWIKVWEDPSFLKCKKGESIQPYLLQYLKFRILDVYRRTLKNIVSMEETEFEQEDALQYDSITEGLDEKELLLILHEALEEQPQILRNVFWLRINNWSAEETAEILSLSAKTVYNKYSESLAIVRAHIRDKHPELIEDLSTSINKKGTFSLLRSIFF